MLAAAYYRIAYGKCRFAKMMATKTSAADANERRHLSFAWLAWDVLDGICKYNLAHYPDTTVRFRFDPFSDDLSKHISVFLEDPEINTQFQMFKNEVENESQSESVESLGWKVVKNYCMRHDGLDQLMFYIVAWGRMERILIECGGAGLSKLHLCLLIIQFGLGLLPTDFIEPAAPWLEQTMDEPRVVGDVNLDGLTGGIGRKLMTFLEFIASRHFQHLARIDFAKPHMECRYILQNGEWQPLHKLAHDTYYRIAFTGSFARLPCTGEQREELSMYESCSPEMEAETFVIEVPPDGFDRTAPSACPFCS